MKRSTAQWMTALAAAALIALPVITWGQTPQPPPTEQPQSAQPPTPSKTQPPENKVDQETSKRHLTAARDALSQLTQLPEAAQLTGDARSQVSQLIANFNELITTQTEWRAAYAKVDANLTALVGPARTDDPNVAPPASAATGATGTSGMATLDPKIRERLVEFRRHLKEFERAAGGAPAAQPTPEPSAVPATPEPSPQPATPPASPTASVATGTAGTMSGPPSGAPAGTTGTTTAPTPAPEQNRPTTAQAGTQKPEPMGHSEAMRHIEAMEAILNRLAQAPADTAGTAGTKPPGTPAATTNPPPTTPATATAGDLRFDKAQIEQLRMHLSELKRLMKEADKK